MKRTDPNYVGKRKLNDVEKQAFYDRQCNRCPICQDYLKDGSHVDHCHKTGRIRGILCPRCNTGLGKFHDSPAILWAAIHYLDRCFVERKLWDAACDVTPEAGYLSDLIDMLAERAA